MHKKTKEFIQQVRLIQQLFVIKEEWEIGFRSYKPIEEYIKYYESNDSWIANASIDLNKKEQKVKHEHFLVHVRFRDTYWERYFRKIKRTFTPLQQRTKEKDIFMKLMKKNLPENICKENLWYLDRHWYSVAESDKQKEPISSIEYGIEICRLDYNCTGFNTPNIKRKGQISIYDNIEVIMNHKEYEKYSKK